jgi:hypothetical protein
MLGLQCTVPNELNTHLIDLHALAMSIEEWDV